MADREMLELAAKAAGLKVSECTCTQATLKAVHNRDYPTHWDPLNDSGAALRLAVRLRLHIAPGETGVEVFRYGFMLWEHEPYGSDPGAATRLAILRCAAEVGRRM